MSYRNKSALAVFVDCINVTGGVIEYPDGTSAPEGDHDWIDLGDAYLDACAELGVEPVSRKVEADYDC